MTSTRALLVVTEDGYAKRVPLADVRMTRRDGGRAKGVRLSSSPVAALITVDGDDGDIVIATASGKVERIAVIDVPRRRRSVTSKGVVAKGVRIVTLAKGDRVAAAALETSAAVLPSHAKPLRADMWLGGRVGLKSGEKTSDARVLHPLKPLHEIKPGGRPTSARTKSTAPASIYWCAHCAQQYPDPHAAYACIATHATSAHACSIAA